MKFSFIPASIAIILTSLTSASPVEVEARELAARATSATISGYTVSCTASSCSYHATIQILPENAVVSFTATSAGPAITSSGVLFALWSNMILIGTFQADFHN